MIANRRDRLAAGGLAGSAAPAVRAAIRTTL